MDLLHSALFAGPLLLAIVIPTSAVVVGWRLRVVVVVAFVPVGLLLLSALIQRLPVGALEGAAPTISHARADSSFSRSSFW